MRLSNALLNGLSLLLTKQDTGYTSYRIEVVLFCLKTYYIPLKDSLNKNSVEYISRQKIAINKGVILIIQKIGA